MDSEPSDQRLMGELARGRDECLGELMRRWQNRVLCFIDRMCGRLGRNEDLFQEVWTRIYLYRARYDAQRPFRPFLFSVVVNCCRTALSRPDWHAPARLDDLDPSRLGVSEADPPDRLIWTEQCHALRRAIHSLPEVQRAVVLLYLLYDSDYAQIARVLGQPVANVRANMYYALKNLRGRLESLAAAESHSRQPAAPPVQQPVRRMP